MCPRAASSAAASSAAAAHWSSVAPIGGCVVTAMRRGPGSTPMASVAARRTGGAASTSSNAAASRTERVSTPSTVVPYVGRSSSGPKDTTPRVGFNPTSPQNDAGLTDRPGTVGPVRHRAQPRAERGRRAAARTARGPRRVPRIPTRAVAARSRSCCCRTPVRSSFRRSRTLRHGSVRRRGRRCGRGVVGEHLARVRRGQTRDVDDVLDRDRDAVKRWESPNGCCCTASSAARAAARAPSTSTATNARKAGLYRSMRSRYRSSNADDETAPVRMAAACPTASAQITSSTASPAMSALWPGLRASAFRD